MRGRVGLPVPLHGPGHMLAARMPSPRRHGFASSRPAPSVVCNTEIPSHASLGPCWFGTPDATEERVEAATVAMKRIIQQAKKGGREKIALLDIEDAEFVVQYINSNADAIVFLQSA